MPVSKADNPTIAAIIDDSRRLQASEPSTQSYSRVIVHHRRLCKATRPLRYALALTLHTNSKGLIFLSFLTNSVLSMIHFLMLAFIYYLKSETLWYVQLNIYII